MIAVRKADDWATWTTWAHGRVTGDNCGSVRGCWMLEWMTMTGERGCWTLEWMTMTAERGYWTSEWMAMTAGCGGGQMGWRLVDEGLYVRSNACYRLRFVCQMFRALLKAIYAASSW